MPDAEVIERVIEAAEAGRRPADPLSSALGATLAAITMLFAAFSSAYIVRRGLSTGWTPLYLPRIAWISLVPLVVGGAALEWIGRRASPSLLYRSAAAGLSVICGILIAESWRQLAVRGASIASSAAAAFFLVFIAAFLLCLAGGLVLLLKGSMRTARLYWRFLSALWIWLLVLMTVYP